MFFITMNKKQRTWRRLRRSRLASLFEGGGPPKGGTEGVSKFSADTPPVSFADSPLREGARRALPICKRFCQNMQSPVKKGLRPWVK